MKKNLALILLLLILVPRTEAAKTLRPIVKEFTEADAPQLQKKSAAYEEYKNNTEKNFKIEGSLKKNYVEYAQRITVPGMISAHPLQKIAKIIGPLNGIIFKGDKVYLRWIGGPSPQVGSVFSVYSPAIVLQNVDNPTDFIARVPKKEHESWPKDFRPAGYMYDTNAEIQITNVSAGLVEAVVMNLRGIISVDDEIMLPLPRYQSITPITSSHPVTAAVVAGSPYDRLATMPHNFVYINRGSRDGMKIGHIFEAVESVKLEESNTKAPSRSLGSAIIVFVSDAFSTAMITNQFDMIHVGSLLKTKNIGPEGPENFKLRSGEILPLTAAPIAVAPQEFDLKSKVESIKTDQPDIKAAKPILEKPKLSELDELEKREQAKTLTMEEKNRLEQLNKQESASKEQEPSPNTQAQIPANPPDGDAPSLPPPPSAFVQGKNTAIKDKKKNLKKDKKKSRDEEELNQLMMQN